MAHWRGGLDEIYTYFVNSYHFQDRPEERKLVSQQDFDEMHTIVRAASGKTLSLLQDTAKCILTVTQTASDSGTLGRDDIVQKCIKETIGRSDHSEQAMEDTSEHVKRQITTTAPPAVSYTH